MTAPNLPETIDPVTFFARPRSGHMLALGVTYVGHGTDWCELALDYDRRLVSDLQTGILASGPIVSLIDSAAAVAVWLKRDALKAQVTLDLRVDYLRPARPGQRVHANCVCYRLTRRVAFVRGIAHDGDPDDPIAHAATSFMLGEGSME